MDENTESVLLIDINIILEMLLQQERARECALFFNAVPRLRSFVVLTDFTLYSVALIACHHGLQEQFREFLSSLHSMPSLRIYRPEIGEQTEIVTLTNKLGLDFDDALQYYTARTLSALLVSFDRHFDKTDLTRKEPRDVLKDEIPD